MHEYDYTNVSKVSECINITYVCDHTNITGNIELHKYNVRIVYLASPLNAFCVAHVLSSGLNLFVNYFSFSFLSNMLSELIL